MDLEVLVVTMDREDLSLADKMALTKNAVLANQCGRWSYEEKTMPYGDIRMVSSDTKGVGINRNIAILTSRADVLLFADDDIKYYDGALEGVAEAFRELPDADVIFFGMDMTRKGEVFDARRCKTERRHIWNSLRFGTARMAIRREAVLKHRLSFSTLFGGGCIYGSGEDTIFIRDCFRAGLHVYSHSLVLGACSKDSSTWFRGFDEKYFFDRGAMLACAFPRLHPIIKWHFARRFNKKTRVPYGTIIKYMNSGIRAFPKLKSFEEAEWIEAKEG